MSRPVWRAGLLLLAGLLASAALAGSGLQWRLSAEVPVICAIVTVETPAAPSAALSVTTACNAERYQLAVRRGAEPATLRAARSSAGPVTIGEGAVIVTSIRPGEATTTIELATPVSPDGIGVTLQPL
jgi:hypothetical protein